MSSQENQGAATADSRIVSQGLDPVDAMLRGRYAQERFTIWVWKRIRDLYPK
jgi:hypothetical protein